MKRVCMILMLFIAGLLVSASAGAQVQELEELALDIEKLAQYKQILSDLKKGYDILTQGYNVIRDVSKGQYDLHKLFLDGLLAVSPEVRKYKRVADVVDYQLRIVSEYKAAFSRFKQGGWFSADELNYMGAVYKSLFNASIKNLDDLTSILTASKLRMSDDERISAIDKIFFDMQDKLLFLRHFNNSTSVLSLQKARDAQGQRVLKQLYGF